MSILGYILFGFVVGLIARAIMPGRDPLGLAGTTILGIIGALVAGWLGQGLGWYAPDEGAGFISATIGAIVVLGAYYFISRRTGGITGSSGRSSTLSNPAVIDNTVVGLGSDRLAKKDRDTDFPRKVA